MARRGRWTLLGGAGVVVLLGVILLGAAALLLPWGSCCGGGPHRARADLATIQEALRLYYARHGAYPENTQGLAALLADQSLESLPVDPWGTPYQYRYEGGTPVVRSLGADRREGGEGLAADLSSSDAENLGRR